MCFLHVLVSIHVQKPVALWCGCAALVPLKVFFSFPDPGRVALWSCCAEGCACPELRLAVLFPLWHAELLLLPVEVHPSGTLVVEKNVVITSKLTCVCKSVLQVLLQVRLLLVWEAFFALCGQFMSGFIFIMQLFILLSLVRRDPEDSIFFFKLLLFFNKKKKPSQLGCVLKEPSAVLGVCCCSYLGRDAGHKAAEVLGVPNCLLNTSSSHLPVQLNVISEMRGEGIPRNSLCPPNAALRALCLACTSGFCGTKLPPVPVSGVLRGGNAAAGTWRRCQEWNINSIVMYYLISVTCCKL